MLTLVLPRSGHVDQLLHAVMEHDAHVCGHLSLHACCGLTTLEGTSNVGLKVDDWRIWHVNLFVKLLGIV